MKDFVDAEFELVKLPRKNQLWRWAYLGLIVSIAGFTLLMGLLGVDIDTTKPREGPIAIYPVKVP